MPTRFNADSAHLLPRIRSEHKLVFLAVDGDIVVPATEGEAVLRCGIAQHGDASLCGEQKRKGNGKSRHKQTRVGWGEFIFSAIHSAPQVEEDDVKQHGT